MKYTYLIVGAILVGFLVAQGATIPLLTRGPSGEITDIVDLVIASSTPGYVMTASDTPPYIWFTSVPTSEGSLPAVTTNGAILTVSSTASGGSEWRKNTQIMGLRAPALTVDNWCYPLGGECVTTNVSSTGMIVPFTGYANNLLVRMEDTQGSGDSCNFWLATSSIPALSPATTTVGCKIGNGQNSCNSNGTQIALYANTGLTFMFDENAGTCTGAASITWTFEKQ